MRELKPMKRIKTAEEIRRREKRLNQREKAIQIAQTRREYRLECREKEAEKIAAFEYILAEDHKKTPAEDKKLSAGTLLGAFSFISCTPFDKRNQIPQGYKPRSFNENRQYTDFFRTFIYPYPVPAALLSATRLNEYYTDEQGEKAKTQNHEIIVLSKKWIKDIVSGHSFYQKNKEYFTRTEAHYFLNINIPYTGAETVMELFFQAKCKARNIAVKQSRIIARVFTRKFEKYFNHAIVTGFLDLLGRSRDYQIAEGELGDICDFVLSIIRNDEKGLGMVPLFSFSGRTMASVTGLANEWHAEIQREQEAMRLLARAAQTRRTGNSPYSPLIAKRWKGIDVPSFKYEANECIWTVTQLFTAEDLLNEGRKMKNCVASYSYRCASGDCAIFNVSCFKDTRMTESKATLEVLHDRTLVQAKGKCNAMVSPIAMNVITRWAQANRIKKRLYVD
jgi:hypothetical protein